MEDIENSIADWQPDIETPEIQEDSQPDQASSDKEKRYLEQLKWRTEQAKIEKFARRTNFDQYESVNRLRDIMKRLGIAHELSRMGATGESLIQIGQSQAFPLVEQ